MVFFSDHGEDLGGWYPNDHGGPNLGHPEESGHGCLLYDTTQLVPLVFRMPQVIPADVKVDTQVCLVDVAPTIYEIMDIPAPTLLDGKSLVPTFLGGTLETRLGYSETYYPQEQHEATGLFPYARNRKAVRIDNRHKVIWEIGGDGVEYYDLLSNPDER